jgi:hypothetical protein
MINVMRLISVAARPRCVSAVSMLAGDLTADAEGAEFTQRVSDYSTFY